MVDRRKREVGQVWRCHYRSYYNGYGTPPGYYLITKIESNGSSDFFTLLNLDTNKIIRVPRRSITTANDAFSWIRSDEPIPDAKPQVVFCRYCSAGNVIESIGIVERYECKFCGRIARPRI